MWTAVRKHCFWWDFAIEDTTHQPVAEVKVKYAAWQRHAISVGGVEHKVSARYRWLQSRVWTLEAGGLVLARAHWQGIFIRTIWIEHSGKQYALKPVWGEWVVYDGEREIGTLAWAASRWRYLGLRTADWRLRVELPDGLPLALRLFVVWCVLRNEAECATA